mmetsp:Transcript_3573/g.8627  ORF Transcript_3573/g.8627 Transcript_3573/m.8627 type:complete len:121 (+) Transcript_3573:449-811(+)
MEHGRPKEKLDKQRRKLMETLTETQVLSLLLPHILARAQDKGLVDQMAPLIKLLEERLSSMDGTAAPRNASSFLRAVLKRFSLARLVELIIGSRQVSEQLRVSVRTALEEIRPTLDVHMT